MNKQEILALKIKRVAGNNVKCLSIMIELIDSGREDIVDAIINLMNYDSNALTAEQIVNKYNECGGKEQFIERCNKIWNKRTYKHEKREYEYEESFNRYYCKEQNYHPEGTRFDEKGNEICD